MVGLAVLREDICSIDIEGKLKITSFQNNTITNWQRSNSQACSIATDRENKIAIGYIDGTIKIWDIKSKKVKILKGHTSEVLAIAIDHKDRIFSSARDKELRVWDIQSNKVKIFKGFKTLISAIDLYPDGRIVVGTDLENMFQKSEQISKSKIRIVNFETNESKILQVNDNGNTNAINTYFDGRIILGLKTKINNYPGNNLIIIDPRPDFHKYNILKGHRLETRDCITMGPRIITCGSESNSEHTLRIWGAEAYVKIEHEKLKLMSESIVKPPYYRALF